MNSINKFNKKDILMLKNKGNISINKNHISVVHLDLLKEDIIRLVVI